VLWVLPLFALLTLIVIALMLRSRAGDPADNLQKSMTALIAMKPPPVADGANAAIKLRQAFSARKPFTTPLQLTDMDTDRSVHAPSSYFEDPAVIAYFQANAPALQQLQAALALPHCNWDCDYTKAYGTLLPHLQYLRSSARLLAGGARLKAHGGDHAGAAQDIAAIYRLADMSDRDAYVICGLVAVACEQIADSVIETVLAYDPPATLDDLAQYRKVLRLDRKIVQRFKRGMELERQVTLVAYDLIATKTGTPHLTFPDAINTDAGFALLYGSERHAAEKVYTDYITLIEKSGIPTAGTLQGLLDDLDGPSFLTRQVISALDRSGLTFQRSQESANLLECALAVQAFKLTHKRDPAELQELVPEFLPALPKAVFKNAQFSIRLDKGENCESKNPRGWFSDKPVLKVYSFGDDGVDNQGLELERSLGPDRVIRLVPSPAEKPEALRETEP